MKGTEKQIAWATDIKNTINQTMSIMIANNKKMGRDTSAAEALTEKMMKNMDAEYAGNIIEDFKDYKFDAYTGDEEQDAHIAGKNYNTMGWALQVAKDCGRNYIA